MHIIVQDNPHAETGKFLHEVIDPDKYYEHSAMSNSDLGELEQKDRDFDPTAAYAFGNLVDHLITEPEKVDVYKHTCNNDVFTGVQMDLALDMKSAFMKDDIAMKIFKMSQYQKIMHKRLIHKFDKIEFTIDARCKWDLWMGRLGWGGDIKTTTATTQSQFEAACKFFHYPRQRFFYMTMGGSDKDMLIGISKVNKKVFRIPIQKGDAFWKEGQEDYERLVVEYWKMHGGI